MPDQVTIFLRNDLGTCIMINTNSGNHDDNFLAFFFYMDDNNKILEV